MNRFKLSLFLLFGVVASSQQSVTINGLGREQPSDEQLAYNNVLSGTQQRSEPQEKIGDKNFPWYGSDQASTKYVPLDQINASNFDQLEIAWTWTSVDEPVLESNDSVYTWAYEATPVMVDGVLFTSSSLSQVAAIDAATGKTIWSYDPESYLDIGPPNHGFVHRGVAVYEVDGKLRVFIATGDAYLIALDAKTGLPVPTFGNGGRIDLTKGLRRSVDRLTYGVSSPPIICRNTVVVGSNILDYPIYPEMPPGDVRGFDARSGELKWVFETVPQLGQEGNETWEDGSWENTGNTNVWTLMSADEELGYVYLPVSTPTNDHYGGNRPGDNLFGESLVVVDAETGEKVWHQQLVHHGLWDYDNPAAPILMDIVVAGRPIKAVAQLTKQAFCFVFDRLTGEPVWPIEERPVPQSAVPGEKTAKTQPFPTKPKPFDHQGVSDSSLIDLSSEVKAQVRAFLEDFNHGQLFTPPSTEKHTLLVPGVAGGASWAGGAFHPEKQLLFIPSVTLPFIIKLQEAHESISFNRYLIDAPYPLFTMENKLPFLKPPYGRITAVDMTTGDHEWQVASGRGWLQELGYADTGYPFRTFVLATKSLLISAQEGTGSARAYESGGLHTAMENITLEPSIRAIDMDSGALLHEIELPANARGSMMSYKWAGRQYIVVPIGGASLPAQLVALALP